MDTRYRIGTYRLQINSQFPLQAAAELEDYLARLGVGAAYISPILESAAGSVHGYDTLDPRAVSGERGGESAFEEFARAANRAGLAVVLDIVPNHLSASHDSPFWRDVLAKGRQSPFADLFDIDWDSPVPTLAGRVLLPILAEHYHDALQTGKLRIETHGDETVLVYQAGILPLSDRSTTAAASKDQEAGAIRPDTIDALIEKQHYRLAYWRLANQEINYRRFFAINSLAGVRVELPEVFEVMNGRAINWLREGKLAGLRIDHPDGLADPAGYLQRLRQAVPDAWIIVEKILASGELTPDDWPVAGTTGYDFLNQVNGLFVDNSAKDAMTDLYARFTGRTDDYPKVLHDCKLLVLKELFGGEIDRLTRLLGPLAAADRRCRDVATTELHDALCEFIACMPVYRTYCRTGKSASDAEKQHVLASAQTARRYRPDIYPEAVNLIADLLPGDSASASEFVVRFQQLCGPAMAKGAEDTAFYRYYRLISLNEVGGDPSLFGISTQLFHEYCRLMQARWPETMNATSTHDTKRSEDVRARINILSEMPDEWADIVTRWAAMNAPLRNQHGPSRNDEYMLYQTLVGVWPISAGRLGDYMRKAIREARLQTSWEDPCGAYEAAVESFTSGVLGNSRFIEELERLLDRLTWAGRINSLAQTILRCTVPGVPDIYQGSELWDFSLVDPDNRRNVDFAIRRQLLAELENASVDHIASRMDSGLTKMHVISRCLALRKRLPGPFGPHGDYEPVHASGSRAEHVVAFSRGGRAITVAVRLPLTLNNNWADTTLSLPAGLWRDELTGLEWPRGDVPLADLLQNFPVALLSEQESRQSREA